MTTMYVLIAGVVGNCSSARGVFSDIALARLAAMSVPKSSQKSSWKEVSTNMWHCADEYVTIEEHILNEDINDDRPKEFDDTMQDDRPKYFQDVVDSGPELMVDSLSDMDLINIWQAQVQAL